MLSATWYRRLMFLFMVLGTCVPGVCSSLRPQDEAPVPAVAPAPHQNPYNLQLAGLQQQFAQATPPQAAVLLGRGYRLREHVDDAAAIQRWMAQVVADPQQHPLVRDEALHYLALIDVHVNDFAAAEAHLRSLGFVREWGLVGPFAAADLDAQLGPEQGFDPQRAYPDGPGRQRRWRLLSSLGPRSWMELGDMFARRGATLAYAETAVYAENPRRVALRFSADSGVALFVNGSQVYLDREETGFGFDQHVIAVELRAGWNSVVVKLHRTGEGAWRFALRLTEPQGGGIAVRALSSPAAAPTSTPAIASAQGSNAPVQDLVQMAQAAADADPHPAAKLEILGSLERDHGRASDFEHLEAAARRGPAAERWLGLAGLCGEPACRFDAINAALRLEPQNARAKAALADYYLGRGQKTKARDLLREAVRLAPDDFVARKRLADMYAAAGLNALALAECERLQAQFPGPIWLRRELAARYEQWGMGDRALSLLQSAVRANYDGSGERALLVHIYERRRDGSGLRNAYSDLARLAPTDIAPMMHLAQLEAGAGHVAAAERILRAALEINAESEELHSRLAEVLAAAGRSDESRRELARALQLNPQLQGARQRLQAGAPQDTGLEAEGAYLANVREVAEAARRNPSREAANAVALADVRVERVYENGLSSVRVQQVYYVASEQGAREYGTRSVQYAPGSQELQVLHARVHKADGHVIEAEESGEAGVADTSVSMYYDVRSRTLSFPVEKGDVLELDYRITPTSNANPYGDYFGDLVVFGSSVPQQLKRFVLITPARGKFSVYQERMPAAQISVAGDERVYRWESRDIVALPNEPRGPALTEVAPYVHVSTFGSWEEIGRWYGQLVRPQFALDAALRDTLTRILAGAKTDLDKIRAIHQFVLRNTHYVALEFGIYSYKPYPVTQVYARRFGDCKDKASLMIALLRAAGIEAEIALVRTRRLGDIGERATSISVFNHAIAYLPAYNLWLDGTAEYAGSRELPLEDQGAIALTVGADGQSQLRRIPVTKPQDNFTRRSVRAQIQSDGAIQFSGAASIRGEDAPGLRRDYEVAERQRDSVRDRLAEIFPSVHVEDVSVDADDLEHDVSVNFRGAVDTFKGKTMLSLPASWIPRRYVQTLAPLASRTQELQLPAPWTTEEELHFALPAGASAVSVPQDKSLETRFGSATLRYQRFGRELVIKTSVQFRQLRVTPAEYAAFRAFCGQVERAFRDEVKVSLAR